MQRILQLCLLLSASFFGCNGLATKSPPDSPSVPAPKTDTAITPAVQGHSPSLGLLYVAVPAGLPIHDGPNSQSGSHVTISYGLEVEMVEGPLGDSLRQRNIPGRMVKARHGRFEGYVFSGLLSALPMPPVDDLTQRWDFQERYAKQLQNAGIKANFEWHEMEDGGDRGEFRLPATNIYEAFLIAKQLYGIPEEYEFPSDFHKVLSTPEHPSPAAQSSPYDYVTHEIGAKFLDGKPVSVNYSDDTEVGGKTISIWQDGDQWVLLWTGFVH